MLARNEWIPDFPPDPTDGDLYGGSESLLKRLTIASLCVLMLVAAAASLAF